MIDMNQHIVVNDDGKPLHTSGFAKVASGDHFGSISTTSYSKRQDIDASRQYIQGYKNSLLANMRPTKVTNTSERGSGRFQIPQRASLQGYNSRLSVAKRPKYGFVEPKARTYDPFA